MSFKQLECHTLNEQTKSLADYYPSGDPFISKNISNFVLHNLLRGLSEENIRAEGYFKSLQSDYIPDDTDIFLEEWESALGIPDDCFSIEIPREERKLNVLVKLASLGVQTVDDFENLAALYGVSVTVKPGVEAAGMDFPLTFPHTFGIDITNPRFTIVVEFTGGSSFPLTFPHTFGDDIQGLLECLYNKLRPANCEVLFVQV